MEKIKAVIKDVKIRKIRELWRKRPTGVDFGDTEAIILTLETDEGKVLQHVFYVRLKANGTFSTSVIFPRSRAKQMALARFLKYYKITEDIKSYNVLKGVKDWIGKKVDIVSCKKINYLYIP